MLSILMFAASAMTMVPAVPAALDGADVEDLVVSSEARAAIMAGETGVQCYEGANSGRRDRETRICLTEAEWAKVEAGVEAGLGDEAPERNRGLAHARYAQSQIALN